MIQIRLIPVLLFATTSLLALKLVDLSAKAMHPAAPNAAEAPMLLAMAPAKKKEPAAGGGHGAPAAKADAPKGKVEELQPQAKTPPPPDINPTERALLERLQERRAEIEARAKEMDMREQMLKAAETRVEERLRELKSLETRSTGAAKVEEEAGKAAAAGLVTMYESMRAKDAARILGKMDLKMLTALIERMNPRKVSDILAAMDSDAAQRLTAEIAGRSAQPAVTPAAAASQDLPKIEGVPN